MVALAFAVRMGIGNGNNGNDVAPAIDRPAKIIGFDRELSGGIIPANYLTRELYRE